MDITEGESDYDDALHRAVDEAEIRACEEREAIRR
jgi:hypothetical protein